ncbi:MAG: hypothetical protein HY908_17430, partial [Myxococcales bacterium]|nr:hypothetical protein [Myxococcales bacterium]
RALTDRALAASDTGAPPASWAGAVEAAARTAHAAEDAVASCSQAAAALRAVVVTGPR